MPIAKGRIAIYTVLSQHGRPVYVGRTTKPDLRWYQHKRKHPDWSELRVEKWISGLFQASVEERAMMSDYIFAGYQLMANQVSTAVVYPRSKLSEVACAIEASCPDWSEQ